MPVHDWTRVEAGIFHAFHHDWITEISRALNGGLLPPEFYALPEQIAGEFGPDVLTLNLSRPQRELPAPAGGIALETEPPRVHLRMGSEAGRYAARAKAVVIHHVSDHRVVAMIEIVSPGNKSSRTALNAFVHKAREALACDVNLLIVDLFAPTARDPQGIHRAIWEDDCGPDYAPPSDRPLTCVAYTAGAGAEAFISFARIGEPLPKMPLFLTRDVYIDVPLEPTYDSAWQSLPAYWRGVLTSS